MVFEIVIALIIFSMIGLILDGLSHTTIIESSAKILSSVFLIAVIIIGILFYAKLVGVIK